MLSVGNGKRIEISLLQLHILKQPPKQSRPASCHITTFRLTIPIKKNSVSLVRERTIPTERPPPVGEVSANIYGQRGVTWSAQRIPTAINHCFLTGAATFYSSSSSVDLTRLSGPRSRHTTTHNSYKPSPIRTHYAVLSQLSAHKYHYSNNFPPLISTLKFTSFHSVRCKREISMAIRSSLQF